MASIDVLEAMFECFCGPVGFMAGFATFIPPVPSKFIRWASHLMRVNYRPLASIFKAWVFQTNSYPKFRGVW